MPDVRPSTCALLIALVAGCGEDSFTPVDAPGADATAIDATADDATAIDATALDASVDASGAAVTVTVYKNGVLGADVAVQYHAADGSFIATVMTDANGVATLPAFPAGGSVTVPLSRGGVTRAVGSELTTILDVSPGDHLTFGTSYAGVAIGSLTITPPNSDGYVTKAGCGSYYATQTFTARPRTGCFPLGATTFDAVAYAGSSDLSGDRSAYAVLTDLPLSGSIPNQTGTATFGAPSTTFASHMVSATNITAPNVELGTWGFRNGVSFGQDRGTTATGVSSWSQTMRYADGFFDGVAAELQLRYASSSTTHVVVRTATVATASTPMTSTFDASTDGPGSFDPPTVSGTPEVVSWTAPTWQCRDATGAPDAIQISIVGSYAAAFFGNATMHSWTILAPGTSTSGLRLPSLDPATIGTLWPRASFTSTWVHMTFTADSTTDWAGFRTGGRPFDAELIYPSAPGTRCTATN
jgi:hypothetical protein